METSNADHVIETSPWLRQISLVATESPDKLVGPEEASYEDRNSERIAMELKIKEQGQIDYCGTARFSPYPVILPANYLGELRAFHEAFATALNNIVNRWWKDTNADFPRRMPLGEPVENLLRWLDEKTDDGVAHPFDGHQGSWRSDLLLPLGPDGLDFQVCEINARFPHNWLSLVVMFNQAVADSPWRRPFLRPAVDLEALKNSIADLFDLTKPIHFLGEKRNYDRKTRFVLWIIELSGIEPRFVRPSQLRLVPNTNSTTGFILCHIVERPSTNQHINFNGELLEEVHQIGLKLYEPELFALDPDMLRHVALQSVNDLRSVYFVHDKRILGIVLQELDSLVDTQKVLTLDQADLLRKHIVPTILPGSLQFADLVKRSNIDSSAKDGYIIKPIRDDKSQGILLGKDITAEKWKAILEDCANYTKLEAQNGFKQTHYMIQSYIDVGTFKFFWNKDLGLQETRVVSTYFATNGKFCGIGNVRGAGAASICVHSKIDGISLAPLTFV